MENSRKRAAQAEAAVPTNTVATGASAAAAAESSSLTDPTDAIDVVVVNENDEMIDICATNDSEDEFA